MKTAHNAQPSPHCPRPIRVLHVLASFRTGGTEQGVVNLINHSDPERIDIGLCVLDDAGAEESRSKIEKPDVVFGVTRKRFGNDPSVGLRLARFVSGNAFDVVHSHGWPTYLETWLALKLRPGVRAVHGEHGTSFLERGRRRWAFGRLARRWQQFLFVSETLKEEFRQQTRIPPSCMAVIPNGVDFERFDKHTRKTPVNSALFDDRWFHVGTAGRLHEVKNHWMLLRAAERAKALGLKYRFHLAGDGPLRKEYEEFIRQKSLSDWVHLHGRILGIETFFPRLDMYVLTSRSEGHPNALLEALASGLPVISTPVGDMPRFLHHGVNGWLVGHEDDGSLLDQIAACAADESMRKTVAANGRRDAKAYYSIEVMVEAYARHYEALFEYGPAMRSHRETGGYADLVEHEKEAQ